MSPEQEYQPAALRAPVDPAVIEIYEAASRGELVVCAGAGLSRALPTELPSGVELGVLLDEDLATKVAGYSSPDDPNNLLAVADAGSGIPGGDEALRTEVLGLAPFSEAEPNFGHRALANLLTEGGVGCLLLWNWDDCVERAGLPELLQVARRYEDLRDLDQPSVAKVHGCVTRKRTLLITSSDLDGDTPVWTDEAFAERLRGKTVVFVGIGDVAAYAKRRLRELSETLPELDVWVVSPGVRDKWEGSDWAELFPELDEGRRVAKSADEFFDELARLWLRTTCDRVAGSAASNARADVCAALERLELALEARGPVGAIRWARETAEPRSVGTSVVHGPPFEDLLLGLAVLGEERAPANSFLLRSQGALEIGDCRVEVLVLSGQTGLERVRAIARKRAQALADQGTIRNRAVFAVAGSVVGNLGRDADAELDVAGVHTPADDVVAGSDGVQVDFVDASAALGRAA